MSKLAAIIAATAASAAIAAVITLPAGADESGAPPDKFVTCVRAQGVDIPADTQGTAIKTWIAAHQSDPAVDRALSACKQRDDHGVAPEKLVACLRDQGLQPPATIDQLKPWMIQQLGTDAGKAALHACGFDNTKPDDKVGAPDAAGPCAAPAEPKQAEPASKRQ